MDGWQSHRRWRRQPRHRQRCRGNCRHRRCWGADRAWCRVGLRRLILCRDDQRGAARGDCPIRCRLPCWVCWATARGDCLREVARHRHRGNRHHLRGVVTESKAHDHRQKAVVKDAKHFRPRVGWNCRLRDAKHCHLRGAKHCRRRGAKHCRRRVGWNCHRKDASNYRPRDVKSHPRGVRRCHHRPKDVTCFHRHPRANRRRPLVHHRRRRGPS